MIQPHNSELLLEGGELRLLNKETELPAVILLCFLIAVHAQYSYTFNKAVFML